MDGYNHYIRISEDNIVIRGFSDAFEEPQEEDICILEGGPRHFHEAFPDPLQNERGQYLYKWDGSQMVERSQAELDAEWAQRPPEPPSVEQRLQAAEQALLALMEVL